MIHNSAGVDGFKPWEKLAVFFAAICLLFAIGWLVYHEPPKPTSIVAPSSWTTSQEMTPPENVPIVGLWMDNGQPVVLAVVAHGPRYFEYDALHPRGPASPLYAYPPLWWTNMPGAAR
jgi:hypothetical protein